MEAETNYTLDSPEEGGKNLQSFVGLRWGQIDHGKTFEFNTISKSGHGK